MTDRRAANGGVRRGAGRPPAGRVQLNLRIRKELILELDKRRGRLSRSAYIESLLR